MRLISEILNRVLADLDVQFPQEDKGGIRAAVIAPGHRETVGGADARRENDGCCAQTHSFNSQSTRPDAREFRGGHPKTRAGDKW